MVRVSLALLSASVLLEGCVAPPPCAYDNCYAPPPAPGYAAYPPPAPGQPYVGPDGLTYVDGYPVTEYDGAPVPFVFLPELGWGYYDNGHRWHGAPPELRDRLERAHPGGRGLPPARPGPAAAPPRPAPAQGRQEPERKSAPPANRNANEGHF